MGIGNAEEDVFVQHLHHGRPSWIGLNDQANEGHYLWTNSQPITYTNWANGKSKPPSSQSEDCVYSGGRNNGYHWVVSSCEQCRNFTCKSGLVCEMFLLYFLLYQENRESEFPYQENALSLYILQISTNAHTGSMHVLR